MSFEPPDGILDIGNATLRVGKLEVAETTGLNQGLQNIVKNDLLVTENTEYSINHHWGLKLPTTWVAEFDVKGHSGKYVEFNFYNEGFNSNTSGYTLNFTDTSLTLKYDNGGTAIASATIPTIVGAYRKVNIFFERNVIAVSIDGTRYLYDKRPSVLSRVISATGSAFVNLFIEQDASNSKFKNLRIVNGRFISDKTSNIAFIGGNLGVGVNSPKEALDIRGNMHFNRVSNVSSISVDSNVVTEYTGPHDRPLRKYPEIILPRSAVGAEYNGYRIDRSSEHVTGAYLGVHTAFNETAVDYADSWGAGFDGTNFSYSASTGEHTAYLTGGTTQGTAARLASNVPNGEWVSLKNPVGIKLDDVELRSRNASDWYSQYPTDFQFWGSNDGTTWSHIKTFTGQSANGQSTLHRYHINSTIFYNRHALVVTKIPGTASTIVVSSAERHFHLSEIRFNGHEEGSASLDTTLKSVYNVPATTGTQLEVYYDGRETSSYSGSGTTVTDISPNTNNGTLNGGVGFDSTYKAFTFDGTDDYILTDVTNPEGAFVHSVSTWVKADTMTGSNDNITQIGKGADAHTKRLQFCLVDIDGVPGQINMGLSGSSVKFKTNLQVGVWYHLVYTYNGGAAGAGSTSYNMYVNGVSISVDSGSGSGVLNLDANAKFAVGGHHLGTAGFHFDGSIANVRLYSKALNAGQVQELYDYQKDYFLGSKSQVTLYKGHLGVGVTEPSGQLELAGDERIQEYPPGPMSDFETYIPEHGVFCAYSSPWSTNSNNPYPWKAFNKETSGSKWWFEHSHNNDYPYGAGGATTGYANSSVLTALGAITNGIAGHWIQLKLPYEIKLKSYALTARTTGLGYRMPQNGIIFGSNDGHIWTQIHDHVDTGDAYVSSIGPRYFNVDNTSKSTYRYFRMATTKLFSSSGVGDTPNIGELQFFGTPGPTTLDKGSLSLTLGRSLDVPRVSRYDVDTETPRPEKLVLDFDTTVNRWPVDISGKWESWGVS